MGVNVQAVHFPSISPTFCRLLSDLFDLKDFESNPRSAILLDLYFYTIQFSREQSFNREQTSAFFSIVKDVHEACVGKELDVEKDQKREGCRSGETWGKKMETVFI